MPGSFPQLCYQTSVHHYSTLTEEWHPVLAYSHFHQWQYLRQLLIVISFVGKNWSWFAFRSSQDLGEIQYLTNKWYPIATTAISIYINISKEPHQTEAQSHIRADDQKLIKYEGFKQHLKRERLEFSLLSRIPIYSEKLGSSFRLNLKC